MELDTEDQVLFRFLSLLWLNQYYTEQAELGVPHLEIQAKLYWSQSVASFCKQEVARFSILLRIQDRAKYDKSRELHCFGGEGTLHREKCILGEGTPQYFIDIWNN